MNKKDFEQNPEFNPEQWEANCKKYDANHNGLKFGVNCTFADGKVKLKLEGLEGENQKYQAPIKNLMLKNMTGAVYYLNEMFHPWYADETDIEAEEEKNRKHLHANLEFFIRTLFLSGFEAFCNAVAMQTNYLSARYELDHTRFEDGKLLKSDGSVWNGDGWEKEGKTTHTFLTESIWDSLLDKENAIIG